MKTNSIFYIIFTILLAFSCQNDKIIESHEIKVPFGNSSLSLIVEKHQKTSTKIHLFDGNFRIFKDLRLNPSLNTTNVGKYFSIRESIGSRNLSIPTIISLEEKLQCKDIADKVSVLTSQNSEHYAILMNDKIVSINHLLEKGFGFSTNLDESLVGKESKILKLDKLESSQELALKVVLNKIQLSEHSTIENFAESIRLESRNSNIHQKIIDLWPNNSISNKVVNKDYLKSLDPKLKSKLVKIAKNGLTNESSAQSISKIIFDLEDKELMELADNQYDIFWPNDYAVKYSVNRIKTSKTYLNPQRILLFSKHIEKMGKVAENFEHHTNRFTSEILDRQDYTEHIMQILENIDNSNLTSNFIQNIFKNDKWENFNVLSTYEKRNNKMKKYLIEEAKKGYSITRSNRISTFLINKLTCDELNEFVKNYSNDIDLKHDIDLKCKKKKF